MWLRWAASARHDTYSNEHPADAGRCAHGPDEHHEHVRDHYERPRTRVRSTDHGEVLWAPLRGSSPTTASATHDSTGALIVALTTGCNTTVERVNPTTGRVTVLRRIPQDVIGIALSPDGSRLAYLTHPTCSVPDCTGGCAGPEMFNPNVLVVMDLATGRSTRTATDMPGHPLFGLSWSPDGQQIVAGYSGNRDQLVIFTSSNLNFATAHRVPEPGRHGYFAPTWTTSGIVAAQESGSGLLSPSRLVRMNAEGNITATWPLPSCINGIITATNPTHKRVMVQSNIGYGNGSCSKKWTTQFATTIGTQLHTILVAPNPSAIHLSASQRPHRRPTPDVPIDEPCPVKPPLSEQAGEVVPQRIPSR